MHSVGRHSFPLGDAGQLLGEVQVGQLAAAVGEEGQQVVVLEVQLLVFVVGAGEGDHTARGALSQTAKQQVGEQAQGVERRSGGEGITVDTHRGYSSG